MIVSRTRIIVAALATLSLGSIASASTVVAFSTKGAFDNHVLGVTDRLDFGPATLSFTGVGSSVTIPGANPVSLGVITVSSTSNTFTSVPNNTVFTLLVSQTIPTPGGTGTLTSSITGTIKKTDVAGNAVTITWGSPTTFDIPNTLDPTVDKVNYSLINTVIQLGNGTGTGSANAPRPVSYSSPIYANLVFEPGHPIIPNIPVPLPTSAAGGLGLLGIVAVRRMRNRA